MAQEKKRAAEIEEKRIQFLRGINQKARDYASAEQSIPVLAHHMMAAIVDSMASAFVFNLKVSEKINALNAEIGNLKADIEAIRRAIGIGTDTDTDAKPDTGLKLVH